MVSGQRVTEHIIRTTEIPVRDPGTSWVASNLLSRRAAVQQNRVYLRAERWEQMAYLMASVRNAHRELRARAIYGISDVAVAQPILPRESREE